jgi:competence protein ComEA
VRALARLLLLLLVLLPSLLRNGSAPPERPCIPEGRGTPPRHWLGCATDPGPARELTGEERLALGLPLDVNRATARELAWVPGLTVALAAELVADRVERGPFSGVAAIDRVRGIGPKRLERARSYLEVRP